ncbi:MAG: tetratricopeptide repeat protein [Gemmatimonadaceae bacterium]
MDSARWERIQSLFHAVADLPPNEQAETLQRACADDLSLIADVMALVREDSGAGSVIDRGLADAALRLLDRSTAPLPQDRFGPYRLTGVLGEGGMGVVYRAVRDDLGATAAIKVLRDATLSPARRERFALEQRTLASLNHPAIATLYDADALSGGTPWFAMELVDGVPLTDYCESRKSSLGDRLRLFRAVCEAVQHAHRHLVIHRDLKPSNILVRADGTVKLLDFGIAKQLETLDQADVTRTGLQLMTPAYAAPEQFRGEQVGIHTDVYALGVVLYELLTGRVPFDLSDSSPAAAESIVTTQDAEKPSAVNATAPTRAGFAGRSQWSDLDVLCLTAMHKDPQRRYPTVDALIRDIDHFLAGEPLEAQPDTLRYRLGKFVRRNRRAATSAAAAVLLIIALSAFYTVGLTRARDTAVAEATRTQRIQRFLVSLFEGGDESVGPADSLRVVTLIDRGVQEARSLSAEPTVQAELLETLGGVSTKLGQLDRADTLLRQALDQRRRLLGADHPDVAHSLISLGVLRGAQAKYDTAETLLREALDMSRRHLAPDHPQIAQATDALGSALENRGSYTDAISVFSEAVRLRSRDGEATPELAASMTGLVNNHFYLGNYPAADSIGRQVLVMSRQVFGERHPHVADDLINLGAVQYELGNYAEAEKRYREALVITEGWYGHSHHATASNLTMLGRALRPLNRMAEADSVLREALAIQERVFGPAHPKVASALNDIALIALVRERYAEAESSYIRVVDIYRKAYNGKHYYIGIGIANLASVYMAKGDNVRAERGFREALAMYAQTLPPTHVNVGISKIKLGRSLLRQRRFAEAAIETGGGYEIVAKQTTPSIGWLQNARRDLVAEYDSLGTPEKGARYRAELADSAALAARPK